MRVAAPSAPARSRGCSRPPSRGLVPATCPSRTASAAARGARSTSGAATANPAAARRRRARRARWATASVVLPGGGSYAVGLVAADSSGAKSYVNHTVATSAALCTSATVAPPARSDWLYYGLLAVVGVIVALELLLLVRRKKKP